MPSAKLDLKTVLLSTRASGSSVPYFIGLAYDNLHFISRNSYRSSLNYALLILGSV